jgi:hypothetical protein
MLALGYGRKVELRQLSELLGTVHAAKPKHVLPLRVLSQRGDDLECSGHGRAQANSNEKSPFSSLTAMAPQRAAFHRASQVLLADSRQDGVGSTLR